MRRVLVPLALLPGLGVGPVALAAEAPTPGADTIHGSAAEGDWVGWGDDVIVDPHDPGFDYIIRGAPGDDAPPIEAVPPPASVVEPGTGVLPATADQTPVPVGTGR